jgi:hypothetical protein
MVLLIPGIENVTYKTMNIIVEHYEENRQVITESLSKFSKKTFQVNAIPKPFFTEAIGKSSDRPKKPIPGHEVLRLATYYKGCYYTSWDTFLTSQFIHNIPYDVLYHDFWQKPCGTATIDSREYINPNASKNWDWKPKEIKRMNEEIFKLRRRLNISDKPQLRKTKNYRGSRKYPIVMTEWEKITRSFATMFQEPDPDDHLFNQKVDVPIPTCNDQYIHDLTSDGDVEPNPGPRTNRGGKKAGGRNNRTRRNRPMRRTRNNNNNNANVVHINDIMPYKKVSTLTYLDASPVRNSPGTSFLVYSMRINDLYDPDPLILSGSISNFKEMMSFYSYYRVLTTAIRWSVSNLETFPIAAGIVFSQTNLTGTLPNLAACQNAFENDFATPIRILSAKGGMDKIDINLPPQSISRLLGIGTQYRSDIAYAGAGLATPSIPLWANFIVYAPTGSTLTQGYTNNTTLRMKSEFFGRLNNNS